MIFFRNKDLCPQPFSRMQEDVHFFLYIACCLLSESGFICPDNSAMARKNIFKFPGGRQILQ